MVTLTLSVGQIVYFSGVGGFLIGVGSLWFLLELWKLIAHHIAKPTGSHRRGARRSGNPDRYVALMISGAINDAAYRMTGYG